MYKRDHQLLSMPKNIEPKYFTTCIMKHIVYAYKTLYPENYIIGNLKGINVLENA